VAVGEAVRKHNLRAVRDIVPALGGLALHFDPDDYEGNILEAAKEIVELCIKQGLPEEAEGTLVEVPVCYEAPFAPDIEEVAKRARLSAGEIVKIHSSAEYRVLMVGFAPGHAYMSGLDERLAVPRRANPRAEVPAGSVAIANEQTVIYPYAISGGWSVIGRTPLTVFDAARERPSLLLTGDRVRFRAIDAHEFATLSGEQ
jgi:KipI family sensor histidine kinase inhibitor